MSSGPFPDRVDASKLFARDGRIEAGVPLSRFARLATYLADIAGEAQVLLEFGHDAEGRKQITGSIDAKVQLACQRCLQALPTTISCEVSLLVFATRAELEKQLAAHGRSIENMEQDVLVLDEIDALNAAGNTGGNTGRKHNAQQQEAVDKGGKHLERFLEQSLDVLSLVEDELILGLPLVPMHDDVNCNSELNQLRLQAENAAAPQSGRDGGKGSGNPFAVLAKLKPGADKPH